MCRLTFGTGCKNWTLAVRSVPCDPPNLPMAASFDCRRLLAHEKWRTRMLAFCLDCIGMSNTWDTWVGLSKCHNMATHAQNTQAKTLSYKDRERLSREFLRRISLCFIWYPCSQLDPGTCSFRNSAKYLTTVPVHTFLGSAPPAPTRPRTLLRLAQGPFMIMLESCKVL